MFKKNNNNEISILKETIQKLEEKLYNDPLGCYTKQKFDMDFWDFKEDFVVFALNVNLEHRNAISRDAGDESLKEITEILVRNFEGMVYHIQGEKFNILCPLSGTTLNEIEKRAEKMFIQIEDYLFCMDYDIPVYIGHCECMKEGAVTFSKREALDIAVKNMYRDKKVKRPKNKDILAVEKENERLKKALEEQTQLKEEIEQKEEKNNLSAEKNWLETFNKKRQVAREQKELEKRKQEITKGFKQLDEKKFDTILSEADRFENCIFGHELESGKYAENRLEKPTNSLWYADFRLEFVNYREDYIKVTIRVYPLEFKKAPALLPILVIADDSISYKVESGVNVSLGVGGSVFEINAHFTSEGKLEVFLESEQELVKRNFRATEGECTPIHFGKFFDDKELFPIKKNINGLLDCVVRTKDENGNDSFELSNGKIEGSDGTYLFVRDGLFLKMVEA